MKKRILIVIIVLAVIGGGIYYAATRPRSCRSYDGHVSANSHVMVCGGFSKTVAPSLRIGWCIPGKWIKEVARTKAWLNIAAPTLPQLALAQLTFQLTPALAGSFVTVADRVTVVPVSIEEGGAKV